MVCCDELGRATEGYDGPGEPYGTRQRHAMHHHKRQRAPCQRWSRVDPSISGRLSTNRGAVKRPPEHRCGDWIGRYFANFRMRNSVWKSRLGFRTRLRIDLNLLWIMMVLLCTVTWPLAVDGLSVHVEEFSTAPAGEQATISCNYTDDKLGSGPSKNGISAPEIRWIRTFANGSEEILIIKTGSTIKGKWFEEGLATVVGLASLQIYVVSFRDEGKYTCKVGDMQGTTELFVDEFPKIQGVTPELVIGVTETLELTCTGADVLSWVWPSHPKQSITISSRQTRFSSRRTSILIIEHMSMEDIGEYRCIHNHLDTQETWSSRPVYVFVTSTEEPLFLETVQKELVHFWDEPSTIPCRVSSPSTTVSLLPMENFTSDGLTSAEVATYDPRVGFTVEAELADYSGNVSCRAVLGNRTDVQSYTVHFVGRPQLSVETPEIVINTTSRLELVCTGVQPMRWLTPSGLGGRLETVETLSQSPNADPVYRNVLSLSDTLWTDTAEYACQYARYTQYDSPQLRSSVYVFVRSSDPKELFLPAAQDVVYFQSDGEPFTVPCRISDPDAKSAISLRIVYTVTTKNVVDLVWTETYDPKFGYEVKLNLQDFTRKLSLLCTNAATDFKSFRLLREGDSPEDDIFKTQIVPSERQLVQGTGPLKVYCILESPFLAYSSWNNHVYPEFEFTFPNKQADEMNGNVNQLPFTIDIVYGVGPTVRFEKILVLQKVSLKNNGTFNCRIHNVETNLTVSTNVSVLASGFVRLAHYPSGQDIVEGVEGQDEVCPQVLMDAYPSATYQWSKDGVNLTNSTQPQFFATEQPHGDGARIVAGCIQNLSLADGGLYTLTAANEYETQTLSVQLRILESPEVNLTVNPTPDFRNPPLYYTHQENSITCHAWGNPLPEISWQWQSCPDEFCTTPNTETQESGWVPIDNFRWASVMDDRVTFPNRKVESVLTLRDPGQAGVFKCLATSPSNKIQEHGIGVIVYRPSDLRTILPAAQVVKTVYTHDQINLTCKANIYAFSDAIVWEWTPAAANSSGSITIGSNDERIKGPVITGYHYQSVLSIEGALGNYSGVYRCRAQQRSDGQRQVVHEIHLNVKDIIPPTFTVELLEHYDLDRKQLLPVQFKLECQASGDPIPSLAWYKDGWQISRRNVSVSDIQTSLQKNNTVVSQLFLAPDITEAHGGEYQCHVSNRGGMESSEGSVHIGASPMVDIEQEVVTGNVGDNLTLYCGATGEPAPTITWKKEQSETGEQEDIPEDMYDNPQRELSFKELKITDDGKYFCSAKNIYDEVTDEVTLVIRGGDYLLMPLLIGGISAGIIFLILLLCLIAMAKRLCRLARKAKRNSQQDVEMFPVNPRSPRTPMSPFRMSFRDEFADHLPFDPKWEFPRDRLKLGSLIGQGAFGMVLKGVAAGIKQNDKYVPVAVKTVKSDSSYIDRKALLGELKMLIQVGHHLNVVNFLGACTQESSPLVIVEFCPYGNLCDYLRSKRDTFQKAKQKSELEDNEVNELNYADLLLNEACVSEPAAVEYELVDKDAKRVAEQALIVEDLVCYCFQVARGMEFLASRKCIHRDLAARNVLLSENNVVKICDFGLSRSIYHDADYIGSGKGLLPIKWMAPEAIFDKVFTTYSDIWSFGVFTWEVFSLGGSPYPGVQVDERFYDKMKSGYRMSCPERAPKEVYKLMLECWKDEPKERPMFSEISQMLGDLLESNTRQEYIDLNIPYSEGMYCELDFGKKKPETLAEETSQTNAGEGARYQTSPTLPTPPSHQDQNEDSAKADAAEEAFPAYGYAAFHHAATGTGEEGAPDANKVQLPESFPEDPYSTGTEQLHTYSSVKGVRPGINCNKDSDVTNSSEDPTSSEETRLHMYASIKGARPDRAADNSPNNADKARADRNHLYSSIKGLRPGLTPDMTSEVKNPEGANSSTEGSSLLGKPKLPARDFHSSSSSLDRMPDGKFRVAKPPLPKRDFSATSWSPERETLLTRPESPEADPNIQPVYV